MAQERQIEDLRQEVKVVRPVPIAPPPQAPVGFYESNVAPPREENVYNTIQRSQRSDVARKAEFSSANFAYQPPYPQFCAEVQATRNEMPPAVKTREKAENDGNAYGYR